jgi:UDP-N-acetylmuramoyl-tripeptide--D-alanyl-D-alanine ligase
MAFSRVLLTHRECSVIRLADVLEALTGTRPAGATAEITGADIDSRQVNPGSLFVALPGEHHDGHEFVSEAFNNGAKYALVKNDLSSQFESLDLRHALPHEELVAKLEKLEGAFCMRVDDPLKALQQAAKFWRNKLTVQVIGITGSVGKSTTKEVVAEVLSQRYCTLKNKGNLNNEIGMPLTMFSLTEQHERAVLEMGFYIPGEIELLCDLASPRIGVVTIISTVHASRAGTQEDIARGKAELVKALPEDGYAILNYDDPLVRAMAEITPARVFFYGMENVVDLWADNVESLGLEGIRFFLHYRHEKNRPAEVLQLRVPLIGRHSVQTALRAAAVGLVDGLTWQEIVSGLRSASNELRLIAVRTKNGALILDDTYNASPESMLAALNLLNDLVGRKVAVLGDMLELGQYEQRGHEMVGIRAAEVVDELVTLGERGKIIAEAALEAGLPVDKITALDQVEQVIQYLLPSLNSNDIVLVKGSNLMRMDRIVSVLEYHS